MLWDPLTCWEACLPPTMSRLYPAVGAAFQDSLRNPFQQLLWQLPAGQCCVHPQLDPGTDDHWQLHLLMLARHLSAGSASLTLHMLDHQ